MSETRTEYILQAQEEGKWHGLLNWVDQPERANAQLEQARADDPSGTYRVDERPYEVDYSAVDQAVLGEYERRRARLGFGEQ